MQLRVVVQLFLVWLGLRWRRRRGLTSNPAASHHRLHHPPEFAPPTGNCRWAAQIRVEQRWNRPIQLACSAALSCTPGAVPAPPAARTSACTAPVVDSRRNGSPSAPESSTAFTTRGFKEEDAVKVGNLIADVLDNPHDAATIERVKAEVKVLTDKYPVYQA